MPCLHILSRRGTIAAAALALAGLTCLAYWPTLSNNFVPFDDVTYVRANSFVLKGLSWEGVRWAFSTFTSGNWHPLTWLSLMLDVECFGADPGKHHAVGLALHILNALLLFGLLTRLTGFWLRSLAVAGLFALHPVHVESVAWITERKDVLSTFFWLLSLWTYAAWTRRPVLLRYLALCGFFLAGLMAKSMLVTLPFALLLLDWWPLRRLPSLPQNAGSGAESVMRSLGMRIVEKLPLFMISVAFSGLALVSQRSSDTISALDVVPFSLRLGNVSTSYVAYLGKLLYPHQLTILYPFPTAIPFWKTAASLALLAAIAFLAWRVRRTAPYLLTGWLWFVGTLVPTIGLVQIGIQSMADRYVYIPSFGLYIALVWGASDILARISRGFWVRALLAAAIVPALILSTRAQVCVWENGVTLFSQILKIYPNHPEGLYNLGGVLYTDGDFAEAIPYFQRYLRTKDRDIEAWRMLGLSLAREQRYSEALEALTRAVKLGCRDASVLPGMAEAQLALGLEEQARSTLDQVRQYNAGDGAAFDRLGQMLMLRGRTDEAVEFFQRALLLLKDDAHRESARANYIANCTAYARSLQAENRLEEAAAALHVAQALGAPDIQPQP